METKVCSKCSTEKPATTDFYGVRGSSWASWCKVCYNEHQRVNSKPRKRDSQLDRDRQAKYRKEAKQRFDSGETKIAEGRKCCSCHEYKTAEHFGVDKIQKYGLRPECKECIHSRVVSVKYKERINAYHQSEPVQHRTKVERWHIRLFNTARICHPKRGLTFSLPNPEFVLDLWNKQQGRCYWFDLSMAPTTVKYHPLQPSLERLDNSMGYEPHNVVLVCLAANRARGKTPMETWREFCQVVRNKCQTTT